MFLCAVSGGVEAEPSRLPWRPNDAAPLQSEIRSVEVLRHDEPLFQAPSTEAARRGAVRLGARLPLFGLGPQRGCVGRWLLVGPSAWICERQVRFSRWPYDAPNHQETYADGLPYHYYFVGPDGSFGYVSLDLAEEGIPDAQLEPGFSVAVQRTEPKPSTGEPFALTTHGLWLPLRDLHPARGSTFQGTELHGNLDAAWVISESTRRYPEPSRRGKGEQLVRHSVLRYTSVVRRGATEWLELADGSFVEAKSVRRTRPADVPSSLFANERWLDIDLAQQVLTAYEGTRAVFATLVSTGRGTGTSADATPVGSHRIWVKLISTDMTNLEDTEASNYYAIEDVPWVMFFDHGYGLHGAFWHRSFGTRRSHGCVNLTPLDAQRLFHWTSPRAPSGWHAVHPTQYDQGTRVIVR